MPLSELMFHRSRERQKLVNRSHGGGVQAGVNVDAWGWIEGGRGWNRSTYCYSFGNSETGSVLSSSPVLTVSPIAATRYG